MTSATSSTETSWTATTLRWLIGIYFVAVGVLHFIVPEGLPAPMAWMYELSDPIHAIAGTAEILGGLGLILPPLVGVAPRLTVAAAAGLVLLMVLAAVWHITRGEWLQIVGNLVVVGILAFLARREWQRQGR